MLVQSDGGCHGDDDSGDSVTGSTLRLAADRISRGCHHHCKSSSFCSDSIDPCTILSEEVSYSGAALSCSCKLCIVFVQCLYVQVPLCVCVCVCVYVCVHVLRILFSVHYTNT